MSQVAWLEFNKQYNRLKFGSAILMIPKYTQVVCELNATIGGSYQFLCLTKLSNCTTQWLFIPFYVVSKSIVLYSREHVIVLRLHTHSKET